MVSSDNCFDFHDSYVEEVKLAMFSFLLVNDLARYKRAAWLCYEEKLAVKDGYGCKQQQSK